MNGHELLNKIRSVFFLIFLSLSDFAWGGDDENIRAKLVVVFISREKASIRSQEWHLYIIN